MTPLSTKILTDSADQGYNLIVDEVLINDVSYLAYAKALGDHTVYYVGVLCDLALMQEREKARGDRLLGLSADQITRVHQGLRASYDFKVDTSHISALEGARQILAYLQCYPNPTAFSSLQDQFDKGSFTVS